MIMEVTMETNVRDKISSAYKLIMWGILLTAAHIQVPILGRVYQILPMFVGHIMIVVGLTRLVNDAAIEYFADSLKSAKMVLIASIIFWIWTAFIFPYTNVLTGCIELFVFVLEIALLGEFLNKTVKLLKENEKEKLADKTRKNRMNFIKFYLGVMLVFAIALIPKLGIIKVYAAPTLMLSVKIFLSLMVQNVARCQIEYKKKEVNEDAINS